MQENGVLKIDGKLIRKNSRNEAVLESLTNIHQSAMMLEIIAETEIEAGYKAKLQQLSRQIVEDFVR